MSDDSAPTIDDVLAFWFGKLDEDGLATKELSARWWKKDPEFDRIIGDRFGATIEAVANGNREDWLRTARGSVAYVIVLDQFTRNVYRGDPKMYAADQRALHAAASAVDADYDRQIAISYRAFLYMPLMHCESLDAQNRCVALFEALDGELSGEPQARMKGNLEAAHAHHKIVDRFGRFPHRNKILGRESTAEETAFLEEPGSSF